MIDLSKYNTPGQLIQELLDARGWTQRVLAIVLNADETGINKIISGKRPVDAELAIALHGLFGVDADNFMELQKRFDLAQARIIVRSNPDLASRAEVFSKFPVSEMIKRRWISVDDMRDFQKVQAELTRFFGAPPAEVSTLSHAAKKTNTAESVTPVQLAWLYRVKQMAGEMVVARYSQDAVRHAIPKLKELLVSPVATRKVSRILSDCGIRFLIVESLVGAKIDGVCFWLDQSSPVIGMSIRYDRIDNFWFVLRHELEHVIQLHGQSDPMLDADLEGEKAGTGQGVAEEERIANCAAAEFCIPKLSLESFIARKSPFYAERDIIGFARTLQVHPGLVAGQLQRRLARYDLFRKHLVKIRSSVVPGTMVDGWGDVAPVD